jgi:pimeloyl-ACP methyl ester carboxylesterase
MTKRILRLALFIAVLFFSAGIVACDKENAPFQAGYADYRDMLVYYEVYAGAEPALVFVHGWACNRKFWRVQQEAFSGKYRVLMLDLPGHGQSGKPELQYDLDLFAGAVQAVMDTNKVEKAVIIGHSMGFAVARQLALNAPERVVGLVSADGVIDRVPEDPAERAEWDATWDFFVKGFEGEDYLEFNRNFLEEMFVESTSDELKAFIIEEMGRTPQHVMAGAMRELAQHKNWHLRPVEVPTLGIYVESQWLPADNEAFMQSLFPNLTYEKWQETGHFLQLERPEKFNASLAAFLEASYAN